MSVSHLCHVLRESVTCSTVSIPAQCLLAMLALDHGKIMERAYFRWDTLARLH